MQNISLKQKSIKHIFGIILLALIFSSPTKIVSAEVYLSKEEALRLICGSDSPATYTPQKLTTEILANLEDERLKPLDEDNAHFFKCTAGKTAYALIDSQLGKHKPITYIMGISGSGEVTGVEIMVYREQMGSGVKAPSFLTQFEKKTSNDQLKITTDIKHVSGATISSISITKGVKRGLLLWQYFFGQHKILAQ